MGPRRIGRVPIVDDVHVIADTLQMIFTRAGYETFAVYSAEEAIELIERTSWIPEFALLDVNLPGMNGLDLSLWLRTTCPECAATFLSGDDQTSELLELSARCGDLFEVLAKPIHPRDLLGLAAESMPAKKLEAEPELPLLN